VTRLERLATKQGLTVQEYLIAHPDYRLTVREIKRWHIGTLRLAARLIKEQHQHVNPARRS